MLNLRYFISDLKMLGRPYKSSIATWWKLQIYFSFPDHLTKFVVLRLLQAKRAEVVTHLLDIFLFVWCPMYSAFREWKNFCNKLINDLKINWPEVYGKLRQEKVKGQPENMLTKSDWCKIISQHPGVMGYNLFSSWKMVFFALELRGLLMRECFVAHIVLDCQHLPFQRKYLIHWKMCIRDRLYIFRRIIISIKQ